MQKFEKQNFNIANYDETNNYSKFVIEPLERGFDMQLWEFTSSSSSIFFTWMHVYAIKFKVLSMNFLQ